MQKNFFLIKKNHWKDLVLKLVKKYSLPEINHNLAIYYKNKKLIYEVNFSNQKCYFRSYDKFKIVQNKYLEQIKSTPSISIENKNIKYFLKICQQLKLNKGNINQIVRLVFLFQGKPIVHIELGTIIGDLMVVKQNKEAEVCSFIKTKDYFSKKLKDEELDKLIAKKHLKSEAIFSDLGIPNRIIQHYADRFAIDLSSGTKTISHAITAKSNDYSFYEKYFELLVQSKMDSCTFSQTKKSFFKPLSIIIPSFNSDETIIKVLLSIESQELEKSQKQLLDVIVIDDGSTNRVQSIIKNHFKKFTFKPKVVRLENNQGLSSARNLGFKLSKYDHILFIDSDVLLSKNYLLEHSVRLQLIPNAIFISFKENVSRNSNIVKDKTIISGLSVPTNFNDKRLLRLVKNDSRWPNKIIDDGIEELLCETTLFKKFGYGRTINGCYDLPSMVVGHNMSMRKEIVNTISGFSNNFSGWGLEDAFFGAKAIAQGNFIIPVLTTGVYHIDHPSRSGSIKKQLSEHSKNTQIYNSLIHEQM